MAWYSILPSHLTVYETWIVRAFVSSALIPYDGVISFSNVGFLIAS